MEETQQGSPLWAWPSFFSQFDDNITLAGYDPRDDPLALEEDPFLESITQCDDQSLGAVPVTSECYNIDVPTGDSQASSAGTLTPESYANIATISQDFITECSPYNESLAWPSFDNERQYSETMSLFDLPFTNDASLWSLPTQDNSDPWTDNAEIPWTSWDFNLASSLGFDQSSFCGLKNEVRNNLFTEGAVLDYHSKCIELHQNELPGNSPESSSTELQSSSPWSLLSSQSPCPESQRTNSRDPVSSQSPCSESPISPGFPDPFYAPPALNNSLVVRQFTVEESISSTGDCIPSPFPFILVPTVPPIPEPRPNESHGQHTPPSRLKARDQRKIKLPEVCPVCHKGHQYRNSMERHIRTRHKKYAVKHKIAEGPFICEICEREYTRSDRLYRHKRHKHGWPPRMKKS